MEGESNVKPSSVDELKLVNTTPLPDALAGPVMLRWKSENAVPVLLAIDSITSYEPPLPTECPTVNVSVMGLTLSKVLEKSRPLSLVGLARNENDPRPDPSAVMFVMTAEAVAVETDPPKAKAAMTNFDKVFIVSSMDSYSRTTRRYRSDDPDDFLHQEAHYPHENKRLK